MASSSSTSQTFNQNIIPKFNGEYYDFWSVKWKTNLRAKDPWEVVENGPKAEATFSQVAGGTPPRHATPSKEDIIKDQCALHILQNAEMDTNLPRIVTASSSKEA